MEKSPISYDLTCEKRDGYVHARIKADLIDHQTALDYLGEIADKCADARCKKLLLERDIPAMLTDGELFACMRKLVRMSSGVKIAFVNRHIPIRKALKHLIGIGAARGADYKYFNDAET